MTGYEKIKRLAKEKKCNVTDLLVLARQNDPFYAGSATQKAMAEWFGKVLVWWIMATQGDVTNKTPKLRHPPRSQLWCGFSGFQMLRVT